jgi:hypothetical protein
VEHAGMRVDKARFRPKRAAHWLAPCVQRNCLKMQIDEGLIDDTIAKPNPKRTTTENSQCL